MKTVMTHPTALKGLLLLTLIANLSYGSSILKSVIADQTTQQTNMSSVTDREPAQAAPGDQVVLQAPAAPVLATGGDVAIGTDAPPKLTPAQLAALKAKRAKEQARVQRSSSTPTDDGLARLQGLNAPPPPPPKAGQKVATPKPDAPKPDAAAPADADASADADKPAPAPAKPAPAKPVVAAADKPAPVKPAPAKPAPAKPKAKVVVRTAAPPVDHTHLAADPGACEGCAREQQIERASKGIATLAMKMSDEDYKNWSACTTNHDRAACDAWAASGQPAPAAPPVAAAPAPDASAPDVATDDDLQPMVDAFVKQSNLLEMSTKDEDKEKIENRMSDLYDKLKDLIRTDYDSDHSGQRSIADHAINDIMHALQHKSYLLSSEFQATSKIHELASIQTGYKIKDMSDKMSGKMDKAASQMADAQGRLQSAMQSGDPYAIARARIEFQTKEQELVSADTNFTRSMSPLMSKLSAYRSDISDSDYAAYTASYTDVQQSFQNLMNQQTGSTQQQGQPSIFQNQNGSAFNTQALMNGVQPISPVPFTGAINSGVGSNLPVFGQTNLTSGQFGQQGFGQTGFGQTGFGQTQGSLPVFGATQSTFGQCQTAPVYNSYMPVQPTCVASPNYALSNQTVFGTGLVGNSNSSNLMVFNSGIRH